MASHQPSTVENRNRIAPANARIFERSNPRDTKESCSLLRVQRSYLSNLSSTPGAPTRPRRMTHERATGNSTEESDRSSSLAVEGKRGLRRHGALADEIVERLFRSPERSQSTRRLIVVVPAMAIDKGHLGTIGHVVVVLE